MAKKNQSSRLTTQQKALQGQVGIFCKQAQVHDKTVGDVSRRVKDYLCKKYPKLTFDYWKSIEKFKINKALNKVDPHLGQTLFVPNASIIPDGGIIVVKDDNYEWRVVLISEAKHQGKH